VNIVVNRKNLTNAYEALYFLSVKNEPKNTSKVKNKNHYKLHPYDLLRAGTNLAPLMKNNYIELNGVHVMNLNSLLKHTQKNKNKVAELIEIKKKSSTPNKRTKWTPPPKRILTVSNNNYSTPPSTPR